MHFDLAGYDILRWSPDQVDLFRVELERRIRRRLAIVRPAPAQATWDSEWISAERAVALAGLTAIGRSGFMEVRSALHPPKPSKTQVELNNAARGAQIETFGWPIAVYLDVDKLRPRPRADGIVASVQPEGKESFDYWAVRRNGDFYFLGSLFEDERRPSHIFVDSRIVRITEAILYCIRLYSGLGIDRAAVMSLAVRHGGLRRRTLGAAGNRLVRPRVTDEDVVESEVSGSSDDFEAHLVDRVIDLAAPIFQVFDFFEVGRPIYEDIVNGFVAGRVA